MNLSLDGKYLQKLVHAFLSVACLSCEVKEHMIPGFPLEFPHFQQHLPLFYKDPLLTEHPYSSEDCQLG